MPLKKVSVNKKLTESIKKRYDDVLLNKKPDVRINGTVIIIIILSYSQFMPNNKNVNDKKMNTYKNSNI